PALIASVHLMGEVVNNLQRLYYNEGYLQAGLGFASIVSSLGLSIYLIDGLLAKTISAMCVSAGFANPIGWSFLVLSMLTVITTSILFLMIQNSVYALNAYCYANTALYPEEPQRFSLDEYQADRLPRDIDSEKVRTAITVIQHDMPKPGVLRYNPFALWFFEPSTSEKLQQIRQLRMYGKANYTTVIGSGNNETTLDITTENLKMG
ncbi:MAG TPA: hypothetical protein VHD33_03750, partial [Legionellaceae bacterium]|nr:hypothetical protein [Legionellaceae bacterium]